MWVVVGTSVGLSEWNDSPALESGDITRWPILEADWPDKWGTNKLKKLGQCQKQFSDVHHMLHQGGCLICFGRKTLEASWKSWFLVSQKPSIFVGSFPFWVNYNDLTPTSLRPHHRWWLGFGESSPFMALHNSDEWHILICPNGHRNNEFSHHFHDDFP